MKSRVRKKFCGCKCAHDKSFDDMVTDDPYPIYILIGFVVLVNQVMIIDQYMKLKMN